MTAATERCDEGFRLWGPETGGSDGDPSAERSGRVLHQQPEPDLLAALAAGRKDIACGHGDLVRRAVVGAVGHKIDAGHGRRLSGAKDSAIGSGSHDEKSEFRGGLDGLEMKGGRTVAWMLRLLGRASTDQRGSIHSSTGLCFPQTGWWANLPTHRRDLNERTTYRPGEEVRQSGIYESRHADGARENVTLLRGARFPDCQDCGQNVTYRLKHAAPYIFEDPDFAP